jgi:hypothetical protein
MASKKNIPGIIPVAGLTSEFGMEWDASLVPISPNYTALEASVYECLNVGCSSIWIVATDKTAPLIRHRLGDRATDLESVYRGRYIKRQTDNHIEVPIYYVPIHPRHKKKNDCYSWSVIWGAHVAYSIMKKFSRWTIPKQYYISFPLGILDPQEVYKYKSELKREVPFYFSYKGKTVKDGLPISFMIDEKEWMRARDTIVKNTAIFAMPENPDDMPYEMLPIEERRKSLKYDLEDVFGDGPDGYQVEVNQYYDLTGWDSYVKLLASELGERSKRPPRTIMYIKET